MDFAAFLPEIVHNTAFKATVVGCLIIFAICMAIDSVSQTVRIGISDHMDAELRHGNVWVVENGAVVQKRFTVDRPQLLLEHNKFQIENIFHQLEAMGLDVEYLEILVDDKVRVYRPDVTRPVYAAAL